MMHRLVQLHIQFAPSDRSVVSFDRRLLCILLFKDLSILGINYSLFYYSTEKKIKQIWRNVIWQDWILFRKWKIKKAWDQKFQFTQASFLNSIKTLVTLNNVILIITEKKSTINNMKLTDINYSYVNFFTQI